MLIGVLLRCECRDWKEAGGSETALATTQPFIDAAVRRDRNIPRLEVADAIPKRLLSTVEQKPAAVRIPSRDRNRNRSKDRRTPASIWVPPMYHMGSDESFERWPQAVKGIPCTLAVVVYTDVHNRRENTVDVVCSGRYLLFKNAHAQMLRKRQRRHLGTNLQDSGGSLNHLSCPRTQRSLRSSDVPPAIHEICIPFGDRQFLCCLRGTAGSDCRLDASKSPVAIRFVKKKTTSIR